jgi:DNA-binding MarR family transcriptional regulator
LAVLITVAPREGCNLRTVVKHTGIDRSTATELVKRLVLQKRRSLNEARNFVLTLSDDGRLLLAAAEPVARNLDAALLQALPPAQREPFLSAAGSRARSAGEIRLSGYENSPDYGGPEPAWREAAVILAVFGAIAGAIWALSRLLSYWDLIG